MAAIVFPPSPTIGQTVIGPNGEVWVWDGTKWASQNASGVAFLPVTGGTMTGPIVLPGNAVSALQAVPLQQLPANSGSNDIGRNKIHNPLFRIAQRGSGPFTAVNAYTLDRWVISYSGDTISVQLAGLGDGVRAAIGDEEAVGCLSNTFTGNAAAASYDLVAQPIEDMRRLSNKTVIVSFYASANSGTPKLGVSLDQDFGTGGSPSAAVIGAGQAVTLSTVWTRYSLMFTLPSMAGKTIGSNNDSTTYLNFWYSSGTNQASRAGSIGVQSGTIDLWGVQVEVAQTGQTLPTPLEKPDLRYDLANCQRFFETGDYFLQGYFSAASQSMIIDGQFAVPKRANPTMVVNSTTGKVVSVTATYRSTSSNLISTAAGNQSGGGTWTASADL